MRAIRIDEHGAAEVLRAVDLPMPEAVPGGVIVRNHAIGVNYVDVQHRQGGYYPVTLPLIPGIEAAGVVEQVGAGVTDFQPGDRVAYAGYMGGNYAEFTPVPQEQLVPIPHAISFDAAAAVLLQGMTAHCMTHDVFTVTSGQRVLVHAAAGGVGALIVQFARLAGAHVIGTVSSADKAAFARAMGADHVINYREQDFAAIVNALTGDEGVHVVYDAIGRATFEGALAVLRRCGHLVVYGQTSGAVPPLDINRLSGLTEPKTRGSLSLTWAALSHYNADSQTMLTRAAAVFALLAAGKLRPHISRQFPLEQAAQAHRLLEERESVGKILLKI
jgi:NADPH2:quinone reductase